MALLPGSGRRLKPRKKMQLKPQGKIMGPSKNVMPVWHGLSAPVVTGQSQQPTTGPGAVHPHSNPVVAGRPSPSTPSTGLGVTGPAATPTPKLSIDDRARAIAMGQLQPALDQYDSQGRQETAAHNTRDQELSQWTKWYQDQLNSAFTDTQSALNSLISQNASTGQGAQDALAAALRNGMAGQNALAQQLGGAVPQGGESDLLQAAVDRRMGSDRALSDLAAAEIGAQGNRRSLAGTQLLNLADTERRRSNAVMKEINAGKQDVLGRLPGLQETARQDLAQLELQKKQLGEQRASRLFQQWLSEKELGLKTKDQSFQQWLARKQLGQSGQELALKKSQFLHSAQIDWANVGIQKSQVEAELAKIEAAAKDTKDKKAADRAKLRGQSIAAGLEALTGYMKVQPGEGNPGVEGGSGLQDPTHMITNPDGSKTPSTLKLYRRNFDDALRTMLQAGTSRSDALRLLSNSHFASWRQRARYYLTRMKRRGARQKPPHGDVHSGKGYSGIK